MLYIASALALGVFSARYFGTSAAKDCYLVAQTIPGLVGIFLSGGVYSSLLLALAEIGPREGLEGQWRFTRRTLGRVTLLLSPILLGAFVFPKPILRMIAPGFTSERLDLSAALFPLTALAALVAVYYSVTRCLFETRSRFGVPAFVNVLVPVVSIGTLIAVFARRGIFALALGPLLGNVIAVVLLIALLRFVLRDPAGFIGARSLPEDVSRRDRQFWMTLLPMSVAANFGQVNLLVDNAFASFLATGSITMLGFAFVIVSNSELLTIFSLAEVAFSRMAAAAHQGEEALTRILRWSLRYVMLATALIGAGMLSFGVPVVRLLFERGQFGPESTLGVAGILACFSLEPLFAGCVVLFSRLMFARKRFRLVTMTSTGAILANALLDLLLMGPFGIYGIAVATTAVACLHMILLLPLVRREVPSFHVPEDWRFLIRVVGSAALMGLLLFASRLTFERYLDVSKEAIRFLEVGGGLTLGVSLYVLFLHVSGVTEARDLVRRLWRSVPLLATRG